MEYQKIVEKIETVLEAREANAVEKIPELSRNYAEACREINTRLDECDLYLRADNYCEAIRLSEDRPRLLESCGILQFEHLPEWKEVCKRLDAAEIPDAINKDAMNRLIAALERPTFPLVKEFRRLTLTKAPLKKRLELLYRLNEMEPDNVCWLSMISSYELAMTDLLAARYEELRLNRNAGAEMKKMLDTVDSLPWQNRPETLYTNLKSWTRSAQIFHAISLLRKLAEETPDLLSQIKTAPEQTIEHYEKLKNSIVHWRQIVSENAVPDNVIPQDVQNAFLPVHEKAAELKTIIDRRIAQENEFKREAREFQDNIKRYVMPVAEMESTWHELNELARSYNLPIPNELTEFYQAELLRAQKRKKNNRILLMASGAAAVLLLGLIVLAVILSK